MALRNWPNVLSGAGIKVVVHPEVNTLGNGTLRDCNIVWHHDASPPGDSPGALDWMKSNYSVASAQIWVDRYGTWHFISYGVAWHAGNVNDNNFDNFHAVGIETDHTTGEAWPVAQLDSLRRGTAAVLKSEGKSSNSLSFHKVIAVPAGRKSDPDGLTLANERQVVQGLIANQAPGSQSTPPPPTLEDDEMILISAPNRGVAVIGPNYYLPLPNNEYVAQASAICSRVVEGNDRQFDLWVSIATAGDSGDVAATERKVDALTKRLDAKGA